MGTIAGHDSKLCGVLMCTPSPEHANVALIYVKIMVLRKLVKRAILLEIYFSHSEARAIFLKTFLHLSSLNQNTQIIDDLIYGLHVTLQKSSNIYSTVLPYHLSPSRIGIYGYSLTQMGGL